jgi:hypothetical protein
MREVVHVRSVEVIGPYRLKLQFTDGLAGEWDFSALATDKRGIAADFANPEFFDKVFLEHGALTWPSGFDWSPEALHADMLAAGALKFEGVAAE